MSQGYDGLRRPGRSHFDSDNEEIILNFAEASATPTANPEGWVDSQSFELRFWRDNWPYRHLPIEELQAMRHGDAVWFLGHMGFKQIGPRRFAGFEGEVLEVGSGPIGFFELIEGAQVTSQDTLMGAYARHIPFSTLGQRGASMYMDVAVPDFTRTFDYVVCSNVLDHTADWIQFLVDCRKRVRPGGELLLVTDSRGAPQEGHTQVFSPVQLRTVLRILGASSFAIDKTVASTDDHCDFRNYVRAKF